MTPCMQPAPRLRKVSCRAAAWRCCALSRLWRSSKSTTTISEPALKLLRRRSLGRRARSRSTPARMAQSSLVRSWKRTPTPSALTRRPASMATWYRRASSTRPKWCARHCRVRPRSPACSSQPRRWSPRCRRSRTQRCREGPAEGEWAAWTSEALDRSLRRKRRPGPAGPFLNLALFLRPWLISPRQKGSTSNTVRLNGERQAPARKFQPRDGENWERDTQARSLDNGGCLEHGLRLVHSSKMYPGKGNRQARHLAEVSCCRDSRGRSSDRVIGEGYRLDGPLPPLAIPET